MKTLAIKKNYFPLDKENRETFLGYPISTSKKILCLAEVLLNGDLNYFFSVDTFKHYAQIFPICDIFYISFFSMQLKAAVVGVAASAAVVLPAVVVAAPPFSVGFAASPAAVVAPPLSIVLAAVVSPAFAIVSEAVVAPAVVVAAVVVSLAVDSAAAGTFARQLKMLSLKRGQQTPLFSC
jgi:hypothetical protein